MVKSGQYTILIVLIILVIIVAWMAMKGTREMATSVTPVEEVTYNEISPQSQVYNTIEGMPVQAQNAPNYDIIQPEEVGGDYALL